VHRCPKKTIIIAKEINCPNCEHVFDLENILAGDNEIKDQQQYQERHGQSPGKVDEEKKKKEVDQQQFEKKKGERNFCPKATAEKVTTGNRNPGAKKVKSN